MDENTSRMSIEGLFAKAWYAVYVRPQNELKISRIFRDKLGIETNVPMQKVWKRSNGKKIIRIRPLLSNYVFILTNIKTIDRRLLLSPNGVFGVVQSGGIPAPIPDEQIYSMEKLSEVDRPVYEVDYAKLNVNDKVEVVDGPLKGAVGSFFKINEKTGRFVVCLDLFKRTMITELETDFVRPY